MFDFELLTNWKDVLRHAWSIRWIIVAFFFTAVALGLPMAQPDFPVPDDVFKLLSGLADVAAGLARVLAQKELGDETDQ